MVAPSLTWNLSPQTQLTAQFEYQRFDETPDLGILPLNGRPADADLACLLRAAEQLQQRRSQPAVLGWRQRLGPTDGAREPDRRAVQHPEPDVFPGELHPDGALPTATSTTAATRPSRRTSAMADLTWQVHDRPAEPHAGRRRRRDFRVNDTPDRPELLRTIRCSTTSAHLQQHAAGVRPGEQLRPRLPPLLVRPVRTGPDRAARRLARADRPALRQRRRDELWRGDGQGQQGLAARHAVWQPAGRLSPYGSYTENFGASNSLFNLPDKRLPSQSAQQWEFGQDRSSTASCRPRRVLPADQAEPARRRPGRSEHPDRRRRGAHAASSSTWGQVSPAWQVIGGLAYAVCADHPGLGERRRGRHHARLHRVSPVPRATPAGQRLGRLYEPQDGATSAAGAWAAAWSA